MSEYQRTLRLNVDEECDGSFTLHWSAQKRRLDENIRTLPTCWGWALASQARLSRLA